MRKNHVQALVGVNAKKVIILGSDEVKYIIYTLADYLNEPLYYKEFERKSPLKIINHIKSNKKLEPNSAVIAFSKSNLFKLKQKYESLGNRVSIIYGKLPPSVKIKEAEKFKSGKTDVLITTDAIGMGLNLPIKNIYFNEIEKYDGETVSLLNPSLLKQIAGRAGRYGDQPRPTFHLGEASCQSTSLAIFFTSLLTLLLFVVSNYR